MASLDKVFKEVSVKKLYKDLLMIVRYMGRRQGNEDVLVNQVRQQFRMNMHETDEAKALLSRQLMQQHGWSRSGCASAPAQRDQRAQGGGHAGAEQCVLPGSRATS